MDCKAQTARIHAFHAFCAHRQIAGRLPKTAHDDTQMSFSVTVQPGGFSFEAESDETLLTAALRQSVGLPYGCQEGACGACKCKVTYGQVALGEHLESALSADEAAQGYTLTCRARALGHVVLECDQVTLASLYPPRKMPVRVAELERLAPDVMRVRLQLPANQPTPWRAGQFMEFTLPDGSRRSYSMASAPHEEEDAPGPKRGARYVDLHIRHLPGGKFTDQVFGGGLKVKDILHAESPLGSFFLREDSQKPIVLLASGTGFAPIKAIIEHMQRHAIARPAALYWGGRRPQDLYMHEWVLAQQAAMPGLRYVPVISAAQPEDGWQGRTGYVHEAVLQDCPDLSGHQVYACGAPAMVRAARHDFTTRARLPESEFYADAFTSQADLAS